MNLVGNTIPFLSLGYTVKRYSMADDLLITLMFLLIAAFKDSLKSKNLASYPRKGLLGIDVFDFQGHIRPHPLIDGRT